MKARLEELSALLVGGKTLNSQCAARLEALRYLVYELTAPRPSLVGPEILTGWVSMCHLETISASTCNDFYCIWERIFLLPDHH
jgi:hypothetical protein